MEKYEHYKIYNNYLKKKFLKKPHYTTALHYRTTLPHYTTRLT